MFVTDCFTTGGDSGGPYFDLEGRLVGIINSSVAPVLLRNTLCQERRTDPFSATPVPSIQRLIAGMVRCEMPPFDEAAATAASKEHDRATNVLPRRMWTEGAATAQAFEPLTAEARGCVVAILDRDEVQINLGTIVRSDGLIATLASVLPNPVQCRLSDGRHASGTSDRHGPGF